MHAPLYMHNMCVRGTLVWTVYEGILQLYMQSDRATPTATTVVVTTKTSTTKATTA